jgi:arylsulfatase A-like enzyme
VTNFLVVVADQLRADALGAFGDRTAGTPHLDRLAATGTVFTNAFAQHPVCAPSRASFLSGWYPHTAGHRSFGTPLRADEPNFLRTFREHGYHVTWVGDRGDAFGPGATELAVDEHGFAVRPSTGRWGAGLAPAAQPREMRGRLFYRGRVLDQEDVDFDEAAVRTAEQWLAAPPDRPWVLFAPLVAPHCPFQAPEPWFSLHDRSAVRAPVSGTGPEPAYLQGIRDYYGLLEVTPEMWREVAATYHGMVSRLDHHVGRLVAAAGPDTVVVFFSDHGEYLGDFGVVEKWPSALHSCITRDPLIISGPGVPSGTVDAMVELIDVFPTLLDLAGVSATHAHFGASLLPVMRDPAAGHREYAFSEGGFLVSEEPKFERAPFPYDLKCALQHDRPETVGKAVAVRDRRWTYVWRLYEPAEVYDRAADPDEAHNLAGTPEVAAVEARMSQALLRWLVETGDVLPEREDPRLPLVDLPAPGLVP